MQPAQSAVLLALLAGSAPGQWFRNYETPQTRPLAVSHDATLLFALNTPDNRLAVYSLADPSRPVLVREIVVGLEPVAVAQRTADELWVVNHLGDSISIVSLTHGIVAGTIHVKDEPSDIVFARGRAFVAVATDGEVRVFDGATRKQVGTIPIFGDHPRSLAVAADESRVWVAAHRSGNGTTILPETEPTRPDPPKQAPHLPPPPKVGMIVRADDPKWKRRLAVDLPDHDVFEIDASRLTVSRTFRTVGTTLFNMVPDRRGNLWVANTEARNLVRFEPALRGHAIDSRLTRIDLGNGRVTPFDLNTAISYKKLPDPHALSIALSQPTDVARPPARDELWVTAFGTDRVAVVDAAGRVTARIEVGDTPGTVTAPRRKRGPRALVHHPDAGVRRLYVLNRISQSIAVLDTRARRAITEIAFPHDPTPDFIRQGRGFLYDAKLSGNGTMSCASCHVDGGFDGLAWDLGDPTGRMMSVFTFDWPFRADLHPMKGPLTTQTLFGLLGTAPFHWRGDRRELGDFNDAFATLLGKTPLAERDLGTFVRYMLSLDLPPNPNQLMDRSYSRLPRGESAADGERLFKEVATVGTDRCVNCHALPTGTSGFVFSGKRLETLQALKTASLRTVYKRLGREPRGQRGERLSGFGLRHDGSADTVFDLLSRPVFKALSKDAKRKRALDRFVRSFDTGTAPAVGFSLTVTRANALSVRTADYFRLMVQQAAWRYIDLVAHGKFGGKELGLLWDRNNEHFLLSERRLGSWTLGDVVRRLATGDVATFTGVAPRAGSRTALARDGNGTLAGDEAAVPYGAASPACSRLVLTANSPARIGNRGFALVTTGGPARGRGLLLAGTSKAAANIAGVRVLVDPRGALVLPYRADRNGLGVVPLALPADPRLAGTRLRFQALSHARCAPHGLIASGGLEVVL